MKAIRACNLWLRL